MQDDNSGSDATGPRLTVGEPTPSEAMAAKALQATVIPLSDGRKLHVRKPSVLGQFNLVEALGPELSANATYTQMVMPLNYLGVIEDKDGSRPVQFSNPLQIKALIAELGEEGFDELLRWYHVNVIQPMTAELAGAAAEHQKAQLKNG